MMMMMMMIPSTLSRYGQTLRGGCCGAYVVNDHLPVNRSIEVLAITALAIVAAKDSCLEAFAIFLETS
jgi:hypothetical protein